MKSDGWTALLGPCCVFICICRLPGFVSVLCALDSCFRFLKLNAAALVCIHDNFWKLTIIHLSYIRVRTWLILFGRLKIVNGSASLAFPVVHQNGTIWSLSCTLSYHCPSHLAFGR